MRFRSANTPNQLKLTIRLIGQAIRLGSQYLPIRHLAGRATAIATPKNYWQQIAAIYRAITHDWWHYVFDTLGTEVLTLDGPRIFELTLNSGYMGRLGYGDCDDITIASGALLRSIGMQTIIVTTAHPNSPHIFDHVFLLTKPPPSNEWRVFDPVLYPRQGFGDITRYRRIALWDLHGRMIEKRGHFPSHFDEIMSLYGVGQAGRLVA